MAAQHGLGQAWRVLQSAGQLLGLLGGAGAGLGHQAVELDVRQHQQGLQSLGAFGGHVQRTLQRHGGRFKALRLNERAGQLKQHRRQPGWVQGFEQLGDLAQEASFFDRAPLTVGLVGRALQPGQGLRRLLGGQPVRGQVGRCGGGRLAQVLGHGGVQLRGDGRGQALAGRGGHEVVREGLALQHLGGFQCGPGVGQRQHRALQHGAGQQGVKVRAGHGGHAPGPGRRG